MRVIDKHTPDVKGPRISRKLKKAFKKLIASGTAYKPSEVTVIELERNSRYANFEWYSGKKQPTIGPLTVTCHKLV